MSCQSGGIPAGLPLKNYTQFLPVRSIETGTETIAGTAPPKTRSIYQYQFQADGDITDWQLKKTCHWERDKLDTLGSGASGVGIGFGAAVVSGIGIPVVAGIGIPGSFEYRIIDPSGTIIFWSRVNLLLTGAVLISPSIGPSSFGLYTVTLGPDRSFDWRTRKYDPLVTQNTPIERPEPPVLIPALDPKDGTPTGAIEIYVHSFPKGATDLYVQRADVPDNPKEIPLFSTIANSTMGKINDPLIPNLYGYTDNSAKLGMNYFYRVIAVDGNMGHDNPGIAYSILSYNKDSFRTIIETFVIDGKPTVNHPSRTYSGLERLTYDDYGPTYVTYPKGREETFLLCPPEITGVTDSKITLDFDWYGPMYHMKIPNGSILKLIFDGASFGTFSQRGKAASWQFSYKTESVIWGAISDVANRLISASPEGGGIAVVTAENINSGQSLGTNRARVVFSKGSSAFVLRSRDNIFYVFVLEDNKWKIYFSTNGATSFEVEKDVSGNDYVLFANQTVKVVDVTIDRNGIIYLLADGGNSMYIYRNIDDYERAIFVAPKGGNFRFELAGNKYGSAGMSIVADDFRYTSDNNGMTWHKRGNI